MEVFHAIMVSGTVTGAARMLNTSQPALTGILKHTEDILRFKLFERVKGRLRPTPEAHALMAQIDGVFDRVHVVKRAVDGLRDARSGTLDIVAIPAIGGTLVPAAIGTFLAGQEGISVRFQMRARRDVMELVASGAADLGFGFLSSDYPRLTARQIITRDLICIMPEGHPLTAQSVVSAADLVRHQLISYTSTQGLAPLINAMLSEARVHFQPTIEVGLIINAWAMVNTGTGVAIVDGHSGMQELFPNVVCRTLDHSIPVALEAVHSEDRPLSLVSQKFLEHFYRFVRE